MKEKIQAFLCKEENWKKFISAEPQELEVAKILSVDVTTFMQEDHHVHFDVSLVYSVNGFGRRQSYESGVGILDNKGNMTEVRNNTP